MDWEWELADADKKCKDMAYAIFDALKKWQVNAICCEEKDLTTDKDCH